ncbi:uncharacterized protein SAPINGB_P006179 [Magnusiomyces paraingens]|uniref:Uncharacterized protein n=1 Tax=Magnusiomyces paraingens TaxID=2606893 RepID=A0A5E8C3N8_9ASCO|nr:uncharacterized protein SAPINGB_P006179 [Saprochaete ingens]VVT58384.1 unnamed protein product [Saprochaete ingens]
MNNYRNSQVPYIPDKRFSQPSSGTIFKNSFQNQPFKNSSESSATSGSFVYTDPVVPSRSSLVDNTLSAQISIMRKYSSPKTESTLATPTTESSQYPTMSSGRSSSSSLNSAFLTDDWGLVYATNFQSMSSDDENEEENENALPIDLAVPTKPQPNSIKWPGIVATNPFGPIEPFHPEKYANDARIIREHAHWQSRDVFDQLFSTCRKEQEDKKEETEYGEQREKGEENENKNENENENENESGYESEDLDSLGFRLQRDMVLAACNNYDNMGTPTKSKSKRSIKAKIKSAIFFRK